jgi:FkbM family methyltransferase
VKKYFKSFLKQCFSSIGIAITRLPKRLDLDWYSFDQSCQIPYLSSLYIQVFGKSHTGTLVEIGAFDGITFSNSVGLIKRGWKAVLVEPIPAFAKKCRRNYIQYPNAVIVEKAIAAVAGVSEIRISGPLSTMNTILNSEYKGLDWSKNSVGKKLIQVETTTLNDLLEVQEIEPDFDLLVVDVEGFEGEVFSGFDLKRWHPKAIIVELSDFHPELESGRKEHFYLGRQIIASGYSIIHKDAINTFFVRNDVLDKLFE